jgi:hypothetical protein
VGRSQLFRLPAIRQIVAHGTLKQLTKSSPVSLGAVRILVGSVLLLSIVGTSFSDLAKLPVTLLIPTGLMKLFPWGFYDRLFTPLGMTLLKSALVFTLMLTVAGYATSWSSKLAALLVLFYEGLVRSFGHFNHDEMIAVYFLIVLAFSPCADALSLDNLWKARKPKPGFAYGYPILLMQALLAWSYFSSALIKLRVAGLNYFKPDNLVSLAITQSLDNLHDTHFQFAFWLPSIRTLTPFLVVLVVLWELAFPLAILTRRFRWVILAFGVVFHFATLLLMNFLFFYQLAMYVVFIDWNAALQWLVRQRFIPSFLRLRPRAST